MAQLTNREYWQQRAIILEEAKQKQALDYYNEVEKQYRIAERAIQEKIDAWYGRFAENNKVSLIEAKQLLNGSELKELRWDVNEYIKYGKENALNQNWIKELENASSKVHINRLEALKMQIQQQAEVLVSNQVDGLDKLASKVFTESYYHNAFDIQKGIGVGWDLQGLDNNKISNVIKKPWTTDSKTFSDRIWLNKDKLLSTVQTELTQSFMRGTPRKEVIDNVSKIMGVSKSNAARLIVTESAYFHSEAQKQCFNDLDVEKYEIVATLDKRTSNICQQLDGKVFDMKDYRAGETAPPFHVRCRTVTAPYFEDEEVYRAARSDEGKTYLIPSDMKYKEWKDHFANGGTKEELELIKKGNTILIEEPKNINKLVGVEQGKEMTFEEADNSKPNPNYSSNNGYDTNCQTCVVSYEARRRGFNVEALANKNNNTIFKLSKDTDMAWIDKLTGEKSKGLSIISNGTKTTYEFLKENIKENERYTFSFMWKTGKSGHIIHMDRVNGVMRMYDPQSGKILDKEIDIVRYLQRIKHKINPTVTRYGSKFQRSEESLYHLRPNLLRVDNLDFNMEVVENILKGSEN